MIKRFEDIVAWQKGRELCKQIYAITKNQRFLKDFGLKDQIQRSSISVISNIAEGFERGSNNEFIQFLYIAKGSCGELRTQLYIALDLGYISGEEFDKIIKVASEVSRLIYYLIESLKVSKIRGAKFK
ncbi:MAG: 30S ribosomal protein S23 [Nitrospirae bacterium]|nr:MAG: 30S ribosomal protein S23 [Nitrospirota bacterium]